ncbi:MAG: transposase [Planctomycetes bacterium]|nr:transposase [Planctomycetota bacterium]
MCARYVLRPAIDADRLAWTRRGKGVYRLERPCRDGTKLIVCEPLVLIERLADLVPRPRTNLVTDHGAFAPSASSSDRSCLRRPMKQSHHPRSEHGKYASAPSRNQRARNVDRVAAMNRPSGWRAASG